MLGRKKYYEKISREEHVARRKVPIVLRILSVKFDSYSTYFLFVIRACASIRDNLASSEVPSLRAFDRFMCRVALKTQIDSSGEKEKP